MPTKKEKFVPTNHVKKFEVNLWAIVSALLGVAVFVQSLYVTHLHSCINRAVELLQGDNDEVVRPAKLYTILTGDSPVIYKAKDLASDDQKKDDKAKLDALPNGGVPVR